MHVASLDWGLPRNAPKARSTRNNSLIPLVAAMLVLDNVPHMGAAQELATVGDDNSVKLQSPATADHCDQTRS